MGLKMAVSSPLCTELIIESIDVPAWPGVCHYWWQESYHHGDTVSSLVCFCGELVTNVDVSLMTVS